MQIKEEWQEIIKKAYGFSEEQLVDEFDRLAAAAEQEVEQPGDFEALRKRIEEVGEK